MRCIRCDRPICPECMRDSPVGFQCPDEAGAGRTARRGNRNAGGSQWWGSAPWVTGLLLALNVAAYVATGIGSPHGLGQPQASHLFQEWALQPFLVWDQNSYYRLLTAAFLHANVLHIAVNMLSLVFIGPVVERFLGPTRYVALYLLGALGSSAAVYAFGTLLQSVVGASGALFALLGACLLFARRMGLDVSWLIGIVVLNFVLTFSVGNISKLGHIGGFVTGMVVAVALGGIPGRRQRLSTAVQAAGLAGVLLLIGVIVAVRTATLTA